APSRVAELIGTVRPIWNRLQRVEVLDGPTFLVDTVKAPAESIEVATAVLAKAAAPRKTFVLGMISDYAGNPRKPYRSAYRLGREAADRVIFVGDNSHRSGASEDEMEQGSFARFTEPRALADHIRQTAQPGELIMIKGSRNL